MVREPLPQQQRGQLKRTLNLLRGCNAAAQNGHPVVVDWPSERELPLELRKLYATLAVQVRFV